MSTSSSKLREMINNADQQAEDIDNSVTQIDTQLTELQSQHDAIREGLLDVITGDMTSYLEITKIVEVGGDSVIYETDFGQSTVATFHILDSTGVPIYSYQSVGWDDDTSIQTWVIQFDFGWNYIHQPIGIDGTFGIQSRIDQLENAKGLLTANKNKIENSKTIFEDYAI